MTDKDRPTLKQNIHVRSTTLRMIADQLEQASIDDNLSKLISVTGSLSKVTEDLLILCAGALRKN